MCSGTEGIEKLEEAIKLYYPEEVVEEVGRANDIVDLVGQYVKLKRQEAVTRDCVRFIMRRHLPSRCLRICSCTIVLAAVQAVMYLLL